MKNNIHNKKIIVCSIIVLVSLNTIFYTTINSSGLNDFTTNAPMITGKYTTTNGCLAADLNYLDQMRIANTDDIQQKENIISSLQNDGYLIGDGIVKKEEVISKSIIFETNFDGEKELDFKYIYNDSNEIAMLTDWGKSGYYLTNINGRAYNLLEYNNSIYLINVDKGEIRQVLLEDGEYNKAFIEKNITKMDQTYYQLTWGANPQPNIYGNKFTYWTTRNALKGGSSNSEIRLKNLDTGEDYTLGDIGVNCLGWDMNDNVYYFNYNFDIVSINTNNRKADTILSCASPRSILLYPFIVFPTDKNDGFAVYNITNRTTEYIYNDKLKAVSGLTSNPEKSAILFQNQYYSSDADFIKAPDINLGIYNTADKTIRFMNFPAGSTLQNYSWINNKSISVVLHKINTSEENTYVVDTSYFNNAEQ